VRNHGSPRQAQRRAATRARISDAATRLFLEHGYDETSLAEIAREAGVAPRTLYLHFDSKAAIALDYFDRWLDDFVENVLARPDDEPLAATISAALERIEDAGWGNLPATGRRHLHPAVAALRGGQPELAGHMMERWVAAIERIASVIRERGDHDDSVAPEARAAGVMAAWFGSMLVFRAAAVQPVPAAEGRTAHDVGVAVAEALQQPGRRG